MNIRNISNLLSKKEQYFNYLKFPKEIHTHIYTTNIAENFNSRIEVKRINSGGYFASEKTADIIMYNIINNLHLGSWSRPLKSYKECQYELNQLYHTIYS